MSLPIDTQRVFPTSGVVAPLPRATRQAQTRADQLWSQLTPTQREAVFQALVKVCLSLANPRDSTRMSEVKHDRS
jgi:hypothetical protein